MSNNNNEQLAAFIARLDKMNAKLEEQGKQLIELKIVVNGEKPHSKDDEEEEQNIPPLSSSAREN